MGSGNRWGRGRLAEQYADHTVRSRPSRRGSKPRTKTRPEHRDAHVGTVTAVDRGRYTVLVQGQTDAPVTAMRARELGRKAVVVGDNVSVVGDTSGAAGTLARIVRVTPRRTVLRRTADDTDPTERVLVANCEQLVIVTAATTPEPRPGMIDRCLVAAHAAGMTAFVCITKTDLGEPERLLAHYRCSDVELVQVALPSADNVPADVADQLVGRASVLVGHSGVGKSTLVNALVPSAERATGAVNEVTGRGRHTSSSAVMLPLPQGGCVVDTPGVRSFGLAHVTNEDVVAAFAELAPLTADCPPGCGHTGAECALTTAVERRPELVGRVTSLRALITGRSETPTI